MERTIEQRTRTITFEPIKRHTYSEHIVKASTLLYSRTNCGFRSVVEALKVMNEVFDDFLGEIPCYTTIENWTKKCGLKVYETAGESLKNTDYAEIVDESMMIGNEKLLLTLGVPAEHQGRPLESKDVSVLDIAVAKSWTGENIGLQLQKSVEKVGHDPIYVITDNASVMNKGVRCAQMIHHHDISHSLGMYLERAYKERADFKSYVKLMSNSKFKYNMTKTAYLLPPTQRTISRFINLSLWVKWSSKMLENYYRLNAEERKVFSFIPANASLIDEFHDVIQCVESIEYLCKHNGLSEKTVCESRKAIHKHLLNGNEQMINLGECIMEFLRKEVMLIGKDEPAHNNSSDIIESIFGKYKARKSANKLNGVTSYILLLPIYAMLKSKEQTKNFNFKATLEEVRVGQIDAWTKKNLSPNLVQLRSKCLRKTG